MEQKVQTKCQDSQKKEQKDGITKGWERSTTYETRCSWTAQDAKLVKQGRFQVERKDHHKSSMLHQVSGHYLKSFPWSCYSHKRRNKHDWVTTILDPTWLTQHVLFLKFVHSTRVVFKCHIHAYPSDLITHVVRMNNAHNINTYHDPMCLRLEKNK